MHAGARGTAVPPDRWPLTGSMTRHVLECLAHHAQLCLHMDVVRGRDPTTSWRRSSRRWPVHCEAVELDPRMAGTIPSTKGAL
ncbi:hypothetical protein QJS66_06425 [Kocuria rhizophila]|nr:hypothetical protein QJS66_06425 [Kocuria rhizophila]